MIRRKIVIILRTAGLITFGLAGLFFQSAYGKSPDAIAMRIISNPDHYSALRWYNEKVTVKGSPQLLSVDGYPAVRDGRSVYVSAANVDVSVPVLYTNIYIISYNQSAEQATQDIFGQILSSWRFNINLDSSAGFCSALTSQNCLTDKECGEFGYCSSFKARVTRDTIRMARLMDLKASLESYKKKKNKYPSLSAGSYLPAKSISVWPSWQESFGKELASTPPIDPINKMADCSGYDPDTCWNQESKSFAWSADLAAGIIPVNNFVFTYNVAASGATYQLCGYSESGLMDAVLACNACVPAICMINTCGPDGCGSTCAPGCSGAQICQAGSCISPCVASPGCRTTIPADGYQLTAFYCSTAGEICTVCNSGFSWVGGVCQPIATCPNGVCDGFETYLNCPADCPSVCPDGICSGSETYATCPADCPSVCPDGICSGSETYATCPVDCPLICALTVPLCNAVCPPACTAADDPDCGAAGCCGDGTCNPSENNLTCPVDCSPVCIPTMPLCDTVCPALCTVAQDPDCGGAGCCGDGTCNAPIETPATCPADCPVICVPTVPLCDNVCPPACLVADDPDCGGAGCCGDGTCDPSETPASCAADCAATCTAVYGCQAVAPPNSAIVPCPGCCIGGSCYGCDSASTWGGPAINTCGGSCSVPDDLVCPVPVGPAPDQLNFTLSTYNSLPTTDWHYTTASPKPSTWPANIAHGKIVIEADPASAYGIIRCEDGAIIKRYQYGAGPTINVVTCFATTCLDNDGDGYGTAGSTGCPNVGIDCVDSGFGANLINPGAAEICDGIDNNCAGGIDEGCDVDGDNYCGCSQVIAIGASLAVCPNTITTNASTIASTCDCNDAIAGGATVNPGVTEICNNSIDDNCNALTDCSDAAACSAFPSCIACIDADNDEYSAAGGGSCCGPLNNQLCPATLDCNDTNATINPGAPEICENLIDENCDLVDSSCPIPACIFPFIFPCTF